MATNSGKMGKAPMPKMIAAMRKSTLPRQMDSMGGRSKPNAKIAKRKGY